MKKPKEKKYTFWGNLKFASTWSYKYHGGLNLAKHLLLKILYLVMTVFAAFSSKFLLDALSLDAPLSKVILIVVTVAIVPTLLNLLIGITHTNYKGFHKYYLCSAPHIENTLCKADFDHTENPQYINLMVQYLQYSRDIVILLYQVINVIFSIIEALIFGTLVTSLHPIILLLLVLSAVLQYFVKIPINKFQTKINPRMVENDRKFDYATALARDFDHAKEVRLYNMSDWLDERRKQCIDNHRKIYNAVQNRIIGSGLMSQTLNLLRDGIAYFVLIYQFTDGAITAGTFVMLFTAITSLSSTINGFAGLFADIQENNLKVTEFRKIDEDLPTRHNHGKGAEIPKEAPSIEFRHVSYRYPNAEEDTIKDVSFRIEKGQKIAIVGVNGSGKTTLIKLLCGLYLPTKGEILVNGIPMQDYNIDDYYSLFSAVFQENFILPFSIAEHIAVTTDKEKIDRARVMDAIEQAGLKKKIDSLPDGMDSLLDKEVNDNAIDLSGGEKQKLSLARAIYLHRPVLILDEPTSALDPIAENEMYLRFDNTVQNKTALFISHRLASTHFCDCIFHMENGKIIETGTHQKLMEQGGKYREMYDVQSSYYQEKEDA